jgi:hypothetical protein
MMCKACKTNYRMQKEKYCPTCLVKDLRDTIYSAQITHSTMMLEQNKLIVFIKDNGLLEKYYKA